MVVQAFEYEKEHLLSREEAEKSGFTSHFFLFHLNQGSQTFFKTYLPAKAGLRTVRVVVVVSVVVVVKTFQKEAFEGIFRG